MIRYEDLGLEWLGYATLRIEADGRVVYLDPGRYGVLEGYEPSTPADLVCVTHDHHYDSDAIRQVADEGTTLVYFEAIETDAAAFAADVASRGIPVALDE